MSEKFDVIIVGSGPGCSSLFACKDEVLMVEKGKYPGAKNGGRMYVHRYLLHACNKVHDHFFFFFIMVLASVIQ